MSAHVDTIKLVSLIVCGLLALPHDLVPNRRKIRQLRVRRLG